VPFLFAREKQDELVFQVYMRLFDLHGRHFWIYSQESSGRQSDLRPGVRFNRVRWRMADLLRQVDSLPELPAILHAVFSLNRFIARGRRPAEEKYLPFGSGSRSRLKHLPVATLYGSLRTRL
jgi:hypothetical protein